MCRRTRHPHRRGDDSTIRCCEGCGRDTRDRYCQKCIGHTFPISRAARPPDTPLEDDYGDESDANSVCPDNPLHPYGYWD